MCIGYIDAPLETSVTDWNQYLARKSQDTQHGVDISLGSTGRRLTHGESGVSPTLNTTAKENDKYKFVVSFDQKKIELYQNGQSCGVVFENIGNAIYPAVSKNVNKSEYTIKYCPDDIKLASTMY